MAQNSRILLTGAVMLETMWAARSQDLIDLVSPLVFYAISSVCAPNQLIDISKVLDYSRAEFGYDDMPKAVIEHVLKRNPGLFRKEYGSYILVGNLDEHAREIEKRKEECDQKVQLLGAQIAKHFEVHLKTRRKHGIDEAISDLQGFYSRHGLFFGTNQLEDHQQEIVGNEKDYYIAQYLYEKRDSKSIEYDYAIDLVKGYFLQTAIYLQADNGTINSASYKNVSFYYDTPFLIRLLEFKTDEENNCALELHKALEKQKGSFFYFPQSQREVNNILYAYKKGLGRINNITLEGLDKKNYSSDDVDRLLLIWESKLNSIFHATIVDKPVNYSNTNGSNNENKSIDEQELADRLSTEIYWKHKEGMEADLESVLGIHKLRGMISSEEIEHCKAIFVTTNTKLVRVVNDYYKQNVNGRCFPLLITDSDLAALTWVKSGITSSLPERELLRYAYMASQPTPEMLDKFETVLEKMLAEGVITEQMVTVIRSSSFTRKAVLFASFDENNGINENVVREIENKIREEISDDARLEEQKAAEQQRKKERHARLSGADQKAREYAKTKSESFLRFVRKVATIIEMLLIVGALIGLYYSWKSMIINSIFLVIFAVASALSVIDTWKGKEKVIDQWLVRLSAKQYDRIYKQKREEYSEIAE